MKKLREWLSIQLAKRPGRIVLGVILLFNVALIVLSAVIISTLSVKGTENANFFVAAFNTVSMILDAGCIGNVVEDIGEAGVALAVICLLVVIIGMITFTGAVIGYITNYISDFIGNANAGTRRLHIAGHIVILNWNTRASEIVNDVLYCEKKQKVVILTGEGKEAIEREIKERIADTVARENETVKAESAHMHLFAKLFYRVRHRFCARIVVIVREGDVFSSKQLHDISLEHAKSIVILGSDLNAAVCKYQERENSEERRKGNSRTVKTLMQVADITAAESSDDNQKIIVEITDEWTSELVDKIIAWKERSQKCNIVPVRVNKVLGQILAQFSLMPELNLAYRELFSHRGAEFYSRKTDVKDEVAYNLEYLNTHRHAIPLASMVSGGERYYYYTADTEEDLDRKSEGDTQFSVSLNHDYWIDKKYVVILGHNGKSHDIMEGFAGFRCEWNYADGHDEILKIVVIDDADSLEKADYYKQYPFVVETVAADIYDKERVTAAIERFVSSHDGDTSVLILSDDSAPADAVDAGPLTNLVYMQDIVSKKIKSDPTFDPAKIDVIVEIINPKHYDVVKSYCTNNVVISNRYISKMTMQIGEKDALFDFYNDILIYDTDAGDKKTYDSKEIYVKKVNSFFRELPPECSAEELIRAVYRSTSDPLLPPEKRNPAVVLGYVKPDGTMTLFGGDQRDIRVRLENGDKLIVFSNH